MQSKNGSTFAIMGNLFQNKLRNWVNHRLRKRAVRLMDWVNLTTGNHQGPHLDLGCGTGHNAERMRTLGRSPVVECDVVDYHMLGGSVDLFDGRTLPYSDAQFQSCSLFYALHYAEDPKYLLQEMKRATSGALLVVQSSFDHALGQEVLHLREFFLGRFPFWLLRRCGVLAEVECGMSSFHHFSRTELQDLFRSARLAVQDHGRTRWVGLGVNREWFLLKSEEEGT